MEKIIEGINKCIETLSNYIEQEHTIERHNSSKSSSSPKRLSDLEIDYENPKQAQKLISGYINSIFALISEGQYIDIDILEKWLTDLEELNDPDKSMLYLDPQINGIKKIIDSLQPKQNLRNKNISTNNTNKIPETNDGDSER